MDLIGRNSGGYNLAARQQSTRAWYPEDRVRPMRAEVYWRYAGEVAAAARSLGTFAPGQAITLPFAAASGLDLIFSVVTISPNGIRSVRELADAHEVLLPAALTSTTRSGGPLPLEARVLEGPARHGGRPTVATGVRYQRETEEG